jgi:hypothetical protein
MNDSHTSKQNQLLEWVKELNLIDQSLAAIKTPLSTTLSFSVRGKTLLKQALDSGNVDEYLGKTRALIEEARKTLDRYKKATTYWSVVMRQLEGKRAAHPDLINLREQLANLEASLRHPNLTDLCKEGLFAMFMWVIRQHETILRGLEENPEDTLQTHRYHLSQNADRFEWALEILGFDHTPATRTSAQLSKINLEVFQRGGLKNPVVLRVLLEPRKLEIAEAFEVLDGYLNKAAT